MIPADKITDKDISRWNYAYEKTHKHENKGALDQIKLIGDAAILEEGESGNQFAVWDVGANAYIPKTVTEVKSLLKIGLKGTSIQRLAYTLTEADAGVDWWDTDLETKLFWNGTTWI